MFSLPSYSQLLLVVSATVVLVAILISLRRRWFPNPSCLQRLLNRKDCGNQEEYHEYIVPLLMYEETYPAFGNILALVLARFPLTYFLRQEDIRSALTFLGAAVFQKAARQDVILAMSVIVKCLATDPDVEYQCRPNLSSLVNQFLKQIKAS